MTTQTEALKLALEAFTIVRFCVPPAQRPTIERAITTTIEALAQPEQEPVAHPFEDKAVISSLSWAAGLIEQAYRECGGHNGADSWLMNYADKQGERIRQADHREWEKVNGRWRGKATPPQRKEPEQRSVSEHLEPVALRFNEWTVGKNDLSDHIYIGELTLAGIEDNLEGPEFGEAEIERFDAVIEALQKKLVTGRECKKVPLIAYIGVNNATPPQRTWVGLTATEEQKLLCLSVKNAVRTTAAILKEKNT